jgi:low temperature requirement protein LtrA
MADFSRFLDPPRLRTVEEGFEERHATWLEPFFDLVFVVAVARTRMRGTTVASRRRATSRQTLLDL